MSHARIDWQAWWQLLRAANVFTAMSNVIAGFLLVQRDWQPLWPLLLLILSSVCLYEAGMVLNDVFDADLDAVERPERPIPSGRIHKKNAFRVGLLLLGVGLIACFPISILTEQFGSIICAAALALMILLYDLYAKQTLYGPLVMGSCRFFNVLLGASVAGSLVEHSQAWLWALGIGVYTIGITLIARRESTESRPDELQFGRNLVLCGIIVALFLPSALYVRLLSNFTWGAISLILIGYVGYLMFRLLSEPKPAVVRSTVGALISLFIPIDAAACALVAGWPAGIGVLLLILPVLLLSRWTGQT